jgi:hypothetical protein
MLLAGKTGRRSSFLTPSRSRSFGGFLGFKGGLSGRLMGEFEGG